MFVGLITVFLITDLLFTLSACAKNGTKDKHATPTSAGDSEVASDNFFSTDSSLKINEQDLIYFVFTDRFIDGDSSNDTEVNKDDMSAYHGGDLEGVIQKLDYIKDLGFTTVWLTPVAENSTGGYHGYWIEDFYKVENLLGTMEKL